MSCLRRSRGTREPISIKPSARGRVSSKMGSLVKLRMAKLSSHLMGQGRICPSVFQETLIFREYMLTDGNAVINVLEGIIFPPCGLTGREHISKPLQQITSDYFFGSPGPAARTLAEASNFSKFLAKRAERSAAARS